MGRRVPIPVGEERQMGWWVGERRVVEQPEAHSNLDHFEDGRVRALLDSETNYSRRGLSLWEHTGLQLSTPKWF